jgi:hypothetical protein
MQTCLVVTLLAQCYLLTTPILISEKQQFLLITKQQYRIKLNVITPVERDLDDKTLGKSLGICF